MVPVDIHYLHSDGAFSTYQHSVVLSFVLTSVVCFCGSQACLINHVLVKRSVF